MKKGFALLLAAVLMLTGCGSSSASTDTPVPAETAKETVKETQTEAAGTEEASTEAVDAEQTEDGTEATVNAAGTETESSSDTLVIYFSRTGEQYVVGVIDKGNTAIVAEMIADQTGADLFEVLPEDDHYPSRNRTIKPDLLTAANCRILAATARSISAHRSGGATGP